MFSPPSVALKPCHRCLQTSGTCTAYQILPLRVSDHDGSAFRFRALHDVGLDKKPGFTGTGAADHQHVFVPCVARILGAAAHRQAFRFREDHIIPGIRINERGNIGVRTP